VSFEDQPTQQIRRTPPPAPMPGPLNPAGNDDTTGVLPIDELLGPQGSEPRQETTAPVAPVAETPASAVAPATPATPARGSALLRGVTSGREWVVRGDNGVIVATVVITLMLLLCVATL